MDKSEQNEKESVKDEKFPASTLKAAGLVLFCVLFVGFIIGSLISNMTGSHESDAKRESSIKLEDSQRFYFLTKKPDGLKIASVGKVSDDYLEVFTFDNEKNASNLSFSLDGTVFAYSVEDTIEILDVSTKIVKKFHAPAVMRFKLSKNGQYLGIIYTEPVMMLSIYDMNFELVYTYPLPDPNYIIVDFDVCPNRNNCILIVLNDLIRRVSVFQTVDIKDDTVNGFIFESIVYHISLSPNGRDAAVFDKYPDPSISVLDISSRMINRDLTFKDSEIDVTNFYYSGIFVYFYGKDRQLYLFYPDIPILGHRKVKDDKGDAISVP